MKKVSKSLNNFFTIRDVLEHYDAETIRFFLLSAQYRSPLNYTQENLDKAKASLARLYTALRDVVPAKAEGEDEYTKRFKELMDDDFNTADALAAIFELVKFANTNVDENSSREFAGGLYEELFKLSDVLGLKNREKKKRFLDKEIEDLIQERQAARKAKDFKRADEIRDELLKKGIILKDTREGVKWQRA